MKVIMLESQAGVSFCRDAGSIWEIPNGEANNMIKAGICRKFQEDKDIEIGYKRKLAQLNSLLEDANEVIKTLTNELKAEKAGAKKTSKTGKKNA